VCSKLELVVKSKVVAFEDEVTVLNVSLIGDCASSNPLDVDIELAVTVFDVNDVAVAVVELTAVAVNVLAVNVVDDTVVTVAVDELTAVAVNVLAVASFATKLEPAKSKTSPDGSSFNVKLDPSTINGILFAISLHPHLLFQNEQLLVSCH